MSQAENTHAEAQQLRELRMRMRAMARDNTIAKKSISKRVTVNASPNEVYKTLTDEQKHSALTGIPVKLKPEVMGEVDIDNGRIEGIVTELIEDKHFVMAWRMETEGWPEEHFSTATFILRPEEGGQTTVVLFHQEVPEAAHQATAKYWEDHYVDRLKDAF